MFRLLQDQLNKFRLLVAVSLYQAKQFFLAVDEEMKKLFDFVFSLIFNTVFVWS